MNKIGIFSWFGYNLGHEDNLRLIKNAGFDAASLYWREGVEFNTPDLARKIGLEIDNVHSPFLNPIVADWLWHEGEKGDYIQDLHISCIEDCKKYDIPVSVIHLTSSEERPLTEIGLNRIAKIIDTAEHNEVKIAFENIQHQELFSIVMERFKSPNVGFCYDSGHENISINYWKIKDLDLLSQYGNRLFALHLHDNFGDNDDHLIPFDGEIDWAKKMKSIKNSRSVEYLTLELTFDMNNKRCEIYNDLLPEELLDKAYKNAIKLLDFNSTGRL